MAAKKCLICNNPFKGRVDAKTCSPRCRKRLQLLRFSLAHYEKTDKPGGWRKAVTLLILGLAGILSIFLTAAPQKAQAITSDNDLNFQARLLTPAGAVVPDGTYNIDFKLYNADSTTGTVGTCTGACLWEETHLVSASQGVTVVNGYLSVQLGSITSFPAINWDQQLYLTMNLTTNGTVSCSPRTSCTWDGEMQNSGHSIALTAVPLAFRANQLALAGTNEQVLQFGSSTFANTTTINLQDPGATTANVCYETTGGATAHTCAAATGGTGYIQNQVASAQSANFNIISSSASNTSTIHANASQSVDIFDVNDSSSNVYLGVSSNGSLTSAPATAGTITLGTTSETGTITVGKYSGSSTSIVNIGDNAASSTTQQVNIGASGAGINTVTIGSTTSSSSTAIKAGSGGITVTGATNINNSGSANTSINVGSSGTVTIGNGSTGIIGIQTGSTFQLQAASGITLSNNVSASANIDVTGSLALKKASSDYTSTGIHADINFGNASLVRLNPASALTIAGIANGRDGYQLTLLNVTSSVTVTINNNDTTNELTAANRILTGTGSNLSLSPNASITLVYDGTSNVWRVVGAAAGSGGGGSFLAKNSTDSSSADAGSGYLYNFTNSGSNETGGVLNLNNGTNSGIALNVGGQSVLSASTTNNFPTTPILDNFNRSNGDLNTGNWTYSSTDSGSDLTIASNQITEPTAGGYAESYWNANQYTDSEAYATATAVGTGSDVLELNLRSNGGTGAGAPSIEVNQYWGWIDTSGNYAMGVTINGDQTTLASGTTSALAAGVKVGMQAIGGYVILWENTGSGWTAVNSFYDTQLKQGYIGVGLYNSSASHLTVDNFGGGSTTDNSGLVVNGTSLVQANTQAAFQVQNGSGVSLLSADTAGGVIQLGSPLQPASINENLITTGPGGSLLDSASWVSGQYVQLTPNVSSTDGELEYNWSPGANFDAKFNFYAGGGSGADSTYFYAYCTSTPITETSSCGGYEVAFDEFTNSIFLQYNGTTLSSYSAANIGNSSWHAVEVVKTGNSFAIYYDGTGVISYTDISRTLTGTKFGLGARTGSLNNFHRVTDLTLSQQKTEEVTVNTYGSSNIYTDSFLAFQVQDSQASNTLFDVNTINSAVVVNGGSVVSGFPTTGVLDNFNLPDGNLSNSWTGPAFGSSHSMAISGDQATGNASGWAGDSWTQSFDPDMEAYVTVPVLPTSGDQVDLFVRASLATSSALDGYVADFSPGSNSISIFRIDAGSWTYIGGANQTISPGDSFGISAVGSTITLWYKTADSGFWYELGSASDSTYDNAGYIGLSSDDATARLDNFGGGDAAAGQGVYGSSLVQATSNSALQVNNSYGYNLLNADTTNLTLSVNGDASIGNIGGYSLFNDGFETDDFSQWDSTTGNASISSSVVHGGKYSMEINPNSGSGYNSYATKTFNNGNTAYASAWFDITSASGGADLMALYGSSGAGWHVYYSSGQLCLFNEFANTTVYCGGSFSLSTWHDVELRITTGNPGVTQLWLDSNLLFSSYNQDNGWDDVGGLDVGEDCGASCSNTFQAYADDVSVSTAYVSPGGSRLLSDSFETGDFSLWDYGTDGTAEVDNSTAHSGSYSALFANTSGSSDVYTSLAANDTVYLRGWFKVTSTGQAYTELFGLDGLNNSASGVTVQYYSTSEQVCFIVGLPASLLGPSRQCGGSFTPGVWNAVTLRVTPGNGNAIIQLWANGSLATSTTTQTVNTPSINTAYVGDTQSGDTFDFNVDDVAIATSDPGNGGSLDVQDSLHVGGTASFGNAVSVKSTNYGAFTIQDADGSNTLFDADTIDNQLNLNGGTNVTGFPTTGVLDSFNQAEGSLSTNSNWDGNSLGEPFDLSIAGNQATADPSGASADSWATTFGPDSEAYVTVPTLPSSGDFVGVFVRLSSPTSGTPNGYVLVVQASTSTFSILRDTGGSYSTLGTATQTFHAGDSFGLSAVGSTLTAWYKSAGNGWVVVGSATDSTYTSSGYIGLESDDNVARLDNFGGGTATAGFKVTGNSVLQSANSLTAFQVQNVGGNDVLDVDTAYSSGNGRLILGSPSHNNGVITFANTAGSNSITIITQAVNPAASISVYLPATVPGTSVQQNASFLPFITYLGGDTAASSSTTLANIANSGNSNDALSLTIPAGKTVEFRLSIIYTPAGSTSNSGKFGWICSNAAQASTAAGWMAATATAIAQGGTITPCNGSAAIVTGPTTATANNAAELAEITGSITANAGSSTTVTFQYARSGSAGTTTVKAGSYLEWWQ